jgi:hypothetical protein
VVEGKQGGHLSWCMAGQWPGQNRLKEGMVSSTVSYSPFGRCLQA